jgi:hypothetical protein
MDLTYEGVVPTVVAAGPELRDELAAHIRDNDDVLPHVFVGGSVVPFVLQAWTSGRTEAVERCLAVLEAALGSDDERTRNLVSVSFVENVGPWEPGMRPFVATWPPGLAQEATFYGGRDRPTADPAG